MNAITNPQYASTRQLIEDAYTWQMPERPPLFLKPSWSNQGGMGQLPFLKGLHNPALVLQQQLEQAKAVRDIRSDSIPLVIPVPTSAVLVAACSVVR